MLLQATNTRLPCCTGAEISHETLIGAFAAAKLRTTVQGVWKGAERRVLAMLISIVPQHSVPLHRS